MSRSVEDHAWPTSQRVFYGAWSRTAVRQAELGEKGIRDTADYRAILAAVAAGNTLTDEIGAAAGLGDRLHVTQRAPQILEELGAGV